MVHQSTIEVGSGSNDGVSDVSTGFSSTLETSTTGDWFAAYFPINPIYPGSTISSAYYSYVIYQKYGTTTAVFGSEIHMQKSTTPTAPAASELVQNRVLTTNYVNHSGVFGDGVLVPGVSQSYYRRVTSPDISAVLNEVLALGFTRGNGLMIVTKNITASGASVVDLIGLDDGWACSPQLIVNWTPPAGTTLPAAPTVTSVTGMATTLPSSTIILNFSPYTDPGSDPQSYLQARWDNGTNGVTWTTDTPLATTANSLTIPQDSTQDWVSGNMNVQVRRKDKYDWTDWSTSTQIHVNGPPSASSLTDNSPINPLKTSFIPAWIYTDPDGDTQASSIARWRHKI